MAEHGVLRAKVLQEQLEAVEALSEGHAQRVRAALAERSYREIKTSPPEGWISLESAIDQRLALYEVLGEDGLCDFYRGLAQRLSKVRLLNALAGSLVRAFSTPTRLLGSIPKAWSELARGVEHVTVEFDPDVERAVIRVSRVPPRSHLPSLVAAWRGSVLGVLDLTRVHADIVDIGISREGFTLVVAWADALDHGPSVMH